MGWEITVAAASHAALAGVLAGVVLVLVPLLANRGMVGQHGDVVRLLVLALLLLIIAAVVWGGLSGAPSTRELVELAARGSVTQEALDAQTGRNFATGTVAVIMLAGGALAMLAGLVEGIGDLAPSGRVHQMYTSATVFLSALAVYEAAFFLSRSWHAFGDTWVSDGWALGLMTVAALACASAVLAARRERPGTSPDQLMRIITISISLAASSALLAYVLVPSSDPLSGPDPMDTVDYVVLAMLVVSTLALLIYAVALAWLVAIPQAVDSVGSSPDDAEPTSTVPEDGAGRV